ncbi:hypothetical protein E3N88_10397 [Mikania micrantha]|uniref:Uncharacterized protein n=1 Tax=Mikania micrantha TaxID=192012 RepID=A0A5N6PDC9_9ASTR|nr:hypothetical protein E3N88_10397 [Mikania micrantha]
METWCRVRSNIIHGPTTANPASPLATNPPQQLPVASPAKLRPQRWLGFCSGKEDEKGRRDIIQPASCNTHSNVCASVRERKTGIEHMLLPLCLRQSSDRLFGELPCQPTPKPTSSQPLLDRSSTTNQPGLVFSSVSPSATNVTAVHDSSLTRSVDGFAYPQLQTCDGDSGRRAHEWIQVPIHLSVVFSGPT